MTDDDPLICTCAGVRERELLDLIGIGVTSIDELRDRSGANTECGNCRDDLMELIDDELNAR